MDFQFTFFVNVFESLIAKRIFKCLEFFHGQIFLYSTVLSKIAVIVFTLSLQHFREIARILLNK
ncbi:protein of unknown function [Streptococcus thermophilus]|nr:protein of unknown function [Streptococcus thermophilus]CAD0133961.1 protein of unknown function [Streptococcus thermophilus]CAD0136519.1 protein of unknown function [Streptococcus thermophilus]CAD0193553.1 protein of unknown function [Streptococcus thermophilus]